MFLETLRKTSASNRVSLATISCLIATSGVFGTSYVIGKGWPVLPLWAEILLSVILSFVVALIIAMAAVGLDRLVHPRDENAHPRLRGIKRLSLERFAPKWSAKSILGFALVMLALWLPWYVANFPGGAYFDTYYQIYETYPESHPISIIQWNPVQDDSRTDAWLVDHHPVAVTLLYGAFAQISDALTGSWMLGVATYCALQGIAHVLVFTGSLARLRHLGAPPIFCLLAYIYFCIMPFVPVWAMCMVKDSLFSLLLVPYFVQLAECVKTQGNALNRASFAILFVLLGLALCLTRKNGIFVVVATCLMGLVLFRKHKPAIIGFASQALACAIAMVIVLPMLVFPAANILPGGSQEVLGPLFQQTGRYLTDYPDDISQEEEDAISAVLDWEHVAQDYEFDFEDAIKFRFNVNATDEQILDYLSAYARMGLRHPDSYFGAWASLAGFYVAPTAYANIRMVTVDTKIDTDDPKLGKLKQPDRGGPESSYWADQVEAAKMTASAVAETTDSEAESEAKVYKRYMLWNPRELDWLRNGLDDAYKAIATIPVINLPLLIVTWDFWIPGMLLWWALRMIKSKRAMPKALVLFVPIFILFAFCTISPVYDARYVIPLFDTVPLLACALACLPQSDKPRDESRDKNVGDAPPTPIPATSN